VGILDSLFSKKAKDAAKVGQYWQMLSAYTPVFTSRFGGVYEMELTRAAIHAFATACAKLTPSVKGDNKRLETLVCHRPNILMDAYKFIYRLATILQVENTAFIIPAFALDGQTIIGLYPLSSLMAEVVRVGNGIYVRFSLSNGERGAIEYERVGILTKHQLKSDFYGDANNPLEPTLGLLDAQRQGMKEGIKNSANIRLLVNLSANLSPDDIKKERDRFIKENLSVSNNGGVIFGDNKYGEVKQIISRPYLIDAAQQKLIEDNVFNYFGVNSDILQNKFTEDVWSAFYEGAIEPFALQLSLVLTNMCFAPREVADGSGVVYSGSRLQYATNKSTVEFITQMFDRGMLTENEGRGLFGLPEIDNGNKFYIRREYAEISKLDEPVEKKPLEGNDDA
jgi:hypothetical protein